MVFEPRFRGLFQFHSSIITFCILTTKIVNLPTASPTLAFLALTVFMSEHFAENQVRFASHEPDLHDDGLWL